MRFPNGSPRWVSLCRSARGAGSSRRFRLKGAGSPIVSLACADDDAQGEVIEVFWEYELDRRILEEERWADLAASGFDEPRQFAAFLNTLRWGSVTATDPNLFQAPFRAGIKIDAYQMEPLRKALRLPRVNLFIADDTGLGKTIEAGLIARELLLRKKVQDIVVAAPAIGAGRSGRRSSTSGSGWCSNCWTGSTSCAVRRERGFGVNPGGRTADSWSRTTADRPEPTRSRCGSGSAATSAGQPVDPRRGPSRRSV